MKYLPLIMLLGLLAACTNPPAVTDPTSDGANAGQPQPVTPAPKSSACGTADSGDCALGEFCRRPIGQCDGLGQCVPRPQFCTKEFRPVCSCEATNHGNHCMAASQGVSIRAEGRCK